MVLNPYVQLEYLSCIFANSFDLVISNDLRVWSIADEAGHLGFEASGSQIWPVTRAYLGGIYPSVGQMDKDVYGLANGLGNGAY